MPEATMRKMRFGAKNWSNPNSHAGQETLATRLNFLIWFNCRLCLGPERYSFACVLKGEGWARTSGE